MREERGQACVGSRRQTIELRGDTRRRVGSRRERGDESVHGPVVSRSEVAETGDRDAAKLRVVARERALEQRARLGMIGLRERRERVRWAQTAVMAAALEHGCVVVTCESGGLEASPAPHVLMAGADGGCGEQEPHGSRGGNQSGEDGREQWRHRVNVSGR